MLAVSVITPSRSSRTASYRPRVIARVLTGSRVDRSSFVSLIVSPSVGVGILPNERHVPNPHGGYVAAIAEDPQRARIQQGVLPGARRQVAAKDHAKFINNMELIDTMPPPGLYEILITEKPANPSASPGEAPDFELCIEPRSLDDIRVIRPRTSASSRPSPGYRNSTMPLYATYLQPWIKAMSSPQLARVALKLNPLRFSYSLLSDTSPMVRAVVPLAEKARAERTVPDADNPFVAMQQQFSKAMIDALNLYRDARDQLTKQIGMTGRIIGMYTFGASAPLNALQKKFGLNLARL